MLTISQGAACSPLSAKMLDSIYTLCSKWEEVHALGQACTVTNNLGLFYGEVAVTAAARALRARCDRDGHSTPSASKAFFSRRRNSRPIEYC